MNKRKKNTVGLQVCTYDAVVESFWQLTPLGMIQLPVVKATTVHIPVILGAILLGPWQVPSWEECSVSVLW